jgi:peptidoglycan/LPS O-acetylase OafA/YrhL
VAAPNLAPQLLRVDLPANGHTGENSLRHAPSGPLGPSRPPIALLHVTAVSESARQLPAGTVGEPRRDSGLRPEIQLLRAVAVLAVVFNHLEPGLLPGGYIGVDIFFVISGYLISAHLLRELDRSGRVRIVSFWGRRVRRLLPASLLVLFISAVVSLLVVPATQWQTVMRQNTASALYVQNWVLAHDAQDYFASADSPSPVTHYWSLSLEEQFYLVWPLLAFAAFAVGLRWGRPKAAVLAAFGVVVAGSLVYSIVETARVPSAAYFVTPARMWQLGLGGLLALVPALVHRRHAVAAVGWVALLASVWFLDEGSAVPGWITLVPVLGTAGVIWSGNAFLGAVPRGPAPGPRRRPVDRRHLVLALPLALAGDRPAAVRDRRPSHRIHEAALARRHPGPVVAEHALRRGPRAPGHLADSRSGVAHVRPRGRGNARGGHGRNPVAGHHRQPAGAGHGAGERGAGILQPVLRRARDQE